MKRLFILLFLILTLGIGGAFAENVEILGQPFPDFTTVDTEGNPFTLSEALKDHEAVLINIWASWCGPCEQEFPFLNEVYEKYSDSAAFIALSCESADTLEMIGEYRSSHGITFPMGSDSDTALSEYVYAAAIPTTVIVDRFGNAAFMHSGSFRDANEVERLVTAFLGDQYTQTTVLAEIPRNTSTAAFPVSAERSVIVENPSAQRISVFWQEKDTEMLVYVLNDDTAHLRLTLDSQDDPEDMLYYDYGTGAFYMLSSLLDADRSAYRVDQAMPAANDPYHYTACILAGYSESDERDVMVYLISSEDYIEEFMEEFRGQGFDVTWAFADAQAQAEAPVVYMLFVVDQNGAPVPDVLVNFCTDAACTTAQSDADGVITFDGAPDIYHVTLLKVPAGYSFDADFELYTAPAYGAWMLRVRKDD